ncbi:MAG: hypothetical protein QM767_15925 [Anaeromyxobacter sp.]
MNPDVWYGVTDLTLREDAVPADYKLFGVPRIPGLVIVEQELGDKLRGAKLEGFRLVELSKAEEI